MVPPLASVAITIFLGSLFLISGVVGLALTFWAREMPGFWWSLLSALLAIVAGIVLLARPIQGTLTLTIVVGAYFLADGVFTIMYALEHRRELSERWGWLLASGIVDLMLAGVIIAGLPGSALWAIGLLVGIDMLFGGASLIGMALASSVFAPIVDGANSGRNVSNRCYLLSSVAATRCCRASALRRCIPATYRLCHEKNARKIPSCFVS